MNPVRQKLIDRFQALMRREDGQDLVEYAMIIALMATGATAGMKASQWYCSMLWSISVRHSAVTRFKPCNAGLHQHFLTQLKLIMCAA